MLSSKTKEATRSLPPGSREKYIPNNIIMDASTTIPATSMIGHQYRAESVEPAHNYYDTINQNFKQRKTILSKTHSVKKGGATTSTNSFEKSGRATPSPNKYSFIIKRIVPTNIQRPISYQTASESVQAINQQSEYETNPNQTQKDGFKMNFQKFKRIKANINSIIGNSNKPKFTLKKGFKTKASESNKPGKDKFTKAKTDFMNLSVNTEYNNPLNKTGKMFKSRDKTKYSSSSL